MAKTQNTTTAKPFDAIGAITTIAHSQYMKDTATEALNSAKECMQTQYSLLVSNGVKFGKSMRTCAFARAFSDALAGIQVNGKQYYAKGTITNYVSAMRQALEKKAKVLDLNVSRTKAKDAPKDANATDSTSTKNGVDPEEMKPSKGKILNNQEKMQYLVSSALKLAESEDDENADYDVFEAIALLRKVQDLIGKPEL